MERRTRFSPERLSRVADAFAREVAAGAIPGAVVLVAQGGEHAFLQAFGARDRAAGDPMRTDAIFRAASMAKPITVAAAMLLVEAGRLQLWQPVSRYLPAFAATQVGVEELDPASGAPPRLRLEPQAREMTVQDLMRHTSGITYGQFGDTLVHRAYRDAAVMSRGQSNAEMAAKLAALPLVHQPGTTFEYGMSIDVLGAVVEAVADAPLDRFVAERITGPLGMPDTGFTLAAGAAVRLAEPDPDPATGAHPLLGLYDPAHPPRWIAGGSGLLTTAADYARFAQMLLGGGELDGVRILGRKTVALMVSDHLPPGVRYGPITRALGITAPLPEYGQGFGLGMAVRTAPGHNPNPGSVGDFSWSGISGCYWWADPQEELLAVLMLQAPAVRVHYRALLRDLVYQALV